MALLLLTGCAGGEPSNPFSTSASASNTFGPGDSGTDTSGGDSGQGTIDPDTGVMTGNNDGTSGTGPDPTGDSGPDPDTGDSTGPGCVPSEETCDGTDEDCDGVEDNGNPGGGMACDTGMDGECSAGQTACLAGAVSCEPINVASVEVCDNLDNDCNGVVDDGDPGGGAPCDTGMLGVCSAGVNECQGGAIICEPNTLPSAEVCNNIDDNCDGIPDDGNPGGGGACLTGMPGICDPGTNACVGGAIVCQQNVPAAAAETCGNGLDDDCNGMADDGCGGGNCPFSLCDSPGIPQVAGCDPCVDQVCTVDPFCCSNQWDSLCVGQVETVCMRADCVGAGCAHLVCDQGVALVVGCDPCVDLVCAADPFCCSNSWDGLCVGGVPTQCMLNCPAAP